MTYLKKYGLRVLYTFLIIIISLLLINTLYYFNIINNSVYKVLKIIPIIISIFINAYILGKNAEQKGYLEGLKLSIIIILVFFILTLITKQPIKLKVILYYLIISITSILGSMIGINKKKDS